MTILRKAMPLLLLICAALLAFPLAAQTPDCSFTFTFTTDATQTGVSNLSGQTPCVNWRITFSTTLTLTSTVTFQTSPDNSTWTSVPNSVCSSVVQPPCVLQGTNPLTGTTQGMAYFASYGNYVRVITSGSGGTGTGTVRGYGAKGASANASGIGGTAIAIGGTVTGGTTGSVLFVGTGPVLAQDNANLFYGSSTPTLQVGPRGSNAADATFETYSQDHNGIHVQNVGAQGSGATNGGGLSVYALPGAAISSGNKLGQISFGGSVDTNNTVALGPLLNAFTTQAWTPTALGSKLEFRTVPNGSTTRTVALTLEQDQSATFVGPIAATVDLHCVSAGGCSAGTAALPLSSVYIGNAATNNAQITGTFTAARSFTIPDVTSNTFVIAATSTTATQALFATATAGAPAFRAIASGDIPALAYVTSVGLVGTANQITVTGTSPITGSGSWTLSFPVGGVTLPGTTSGTFSGNLTGNASGTAATITGALALANTPLTARGDILIATTATPILGKLAKGTQYQTLQGGATDPLYDALHLDQSTAVTGILGSAYGGTANGFTKFSGPATAEKTFTLPNANSTIATGTGTLNVIPKWTATTGTLGDSVLKDDGTAVTITQNSVVPFTSLAAGSVVNTLYLNAGFVGMGTSAPGAKLTISLNTGTLPSPVSALTDLIQLGGADTVQAGLLLDAFANSSVIRLRRADGTAASPSAVQLDEVLGTIQSYGYGASTYENASGAIRMVAAENWTNTANGTYMDFGVNKNGTTSSVVRLLRIDNAGTVQVAAVGVLQQLPRTTDPTCSTTADIGKFWFDNTTTTTARKACNNVAGTLTWVTF